ncbi:hypothetical protein BSTP4_002 [Bacillus phage BSTP4]|uniref:Uncharacterized protein n=1 Tax=Bacillus phage BSTP4 TaxID=2801529 RepID=A0A7T8IVT7_9CAUD|nr:hypothetical protein BSTP4_002 [Bacillus phage BSTP4]
MTTNQQSMWAELNQGLIPNIHMTMEVPYH